MDNLTLNYKTLQIDIKKGISLFNDRSAVGKSYFPTLLKKYNPDISVVVYDTKVLYDKFLRNGIDEDYNPDSTIFLFDRLDYFITEDFINKILFYGRSKFILMDLKDTLRIPMGAEVNYIMCLRETTGKVIIKDEALFRR